MADFAPSPAPLFAVPVPLQLAGEAAVLLAEHLRDGTVVISRNLAMFQHPEDADHFADALGLQVENDEVDLTVL